MSAPANIQTSSETRMYDMIPLTEAARRAESRELSMNEDIPLPPPALLAVVHKRGRAAFTGGPITADDQTMLLA